jgi:hypothetical protein
MTEDIEEPSQHAAVARREFRKAIHFIAELQVAYYYCVCNRRRWSQQETATVNMMIRPSNEREIIMKGEEIEERA